MAAAAPLLCSGHRLQIEKLDFRHASTFPAFSLPASSSSSFSSRSTPQHGIFCHVPTFSSYKHKVFTSASNSDWLRNYESWLTARSRFDFCQLRSREAGGERVRPSYQIRSSTEAGETSARGGRRTDAWETGITYSSQGQSVTERDAADRWAQSISVEPSAKQSFELTNLQYDTGMACAVLVGAYVWVRVFDFFTRKKILGQKSSRKIIHITSGLLYMSCWPFFSNSELAPFLAGLVPLANAVRLLVYGFGLRKNEGLVKTMSRSGESRELLRGPLYYVVVLYLSTVLFWRRSPVGMIALAMMCGGDGIADIVGRKFGSQKLPYNNEKSVAGSLAMFLFGYLVSLACVSYFAAFGFFKLDLYRDAISLAVISFAATVVESLPITSKLDDNFTVPVTAFVLGIMFFPF